MSRFIKIAAVPFIVFALYSIVGFWVVPAWIQSQVEKAADRDAINYVRVEQIRFNPYTFSLKFEDAAAAGMDKQWSLQIDAAVINLDAHALLARQPIFDVVEIDAPKLAISRSENFTEFETVPNPLLKANGANSEKGIFPRLQIDRFSVTGGSVDYTDKTLETAYKERLHPIEFTLRNFSAEAEGPSKIRFTARTEADGKLEWESELSRVPFEMKGRFQISNMKGERHSPRRGEPGHGSVECHRAPRFNSGRRRSASASFPQGDFPRYRNRRFGAAANFTLCLQRPRSFHQGGNGRH